MRRSNDSHSFCFSFQSASQRERQQKKLNMMFLQKHKNNHNFSLKQLASLFLLLNLTVLLFSSSFSSAHRRDARFLPNYSRHPSPEYIRLLSTYSTNPKHLNGTSSSSSSSGENKYFGQRVERLDSSSNSSSRGQKRTRTVGVVLNNGLSMPLVGFGTWQLAGNESAKRRTVKAALDAGYRLLDTAYLYRTEAAIGEALAEAFTSSSSSKQPLLAREDVFITTKVWPTFFSRARTLQSISNSLAKLQLSYVDLVLLHFPTGFREGADEWPVYEGGLNRSVVPHSWKRNAFLDSWQALEEAVERNLTRSIGVSNFNRRQMRTLLRQAKVKPVVNQVESHPYFRNEKLRRFLAEQKVLMQAYAPLRRGDTAGLLAEPRLQEIARRYGKSTAQVALRWQLDRSTPPVPLVVKSSSSAERLAANLDLFDFSLDGEEVAAVGALPERPRIYTLPGAETHPDYPFGEE